ncbi:unnamed protein product, partial [Hymenolepis diminuta]
FCVIFQTYLFFSDISAGGRRSTDSKGATKCQIKMGDHFTELQLAFDIPAIVNKASNVAAIILWSCCLLL